MTALSFRLAHIFMLMVHSRPRGRNSSRSPRNFRDHKVPYAQSDQHHSSISAVGGRAALSWGGFRLLVTPFKKLCLARHIAPLLGKLQIRVPQFRIGRHQRLTPALSSFTLTSLRLCTHLNRPSNAGPPGSIPTAVAYLVRHASCSCVWHDWNDTEAQRLRSASRRLTSCPGRSSAWTTLARCAGRWMARARATGRLHGTAIHRVCDCRHHNQREDDESADGAARVPCARTSRIVICAAHRVGGVSIAHLRIRKRARIIRVSIGH